MKLALNRIALATALALAAAGAQAADTFVGLTWGQTNNNIQKSDSLNANLVPSPALDKVIHKTGTWGLRVGQQDDVGRYYATYENISDSDSGNKLRQQNLLGSYDLFLPLGDNNTKLFGGATLGLVKLEQDSRGFSRDSNINYAAGLQAGLLQELNKSASIEAGYRYLRTNVSVDLAEQGGPKLGSVGLHSSGQAYLGANYKF
ncbi:outer membrane beta-barrel protein [Pseudomonas sp. GCM10022186]|uniref:outer membrane beta-barrel protein n=1 Tax=Pseudomonas sp. GCM10022186 TaxID=3252650 RepID=UPI0036162ABF